MATAKSVSVVLDFEKTTKNTVRFLEHHESEMDVDLLGQVYVPKGTLGSLGYTEGGAIKVTIEAV